MTDETDVERRSDAELMALVTGRPGDELIAQAGGLDRLSRAGAFEIASYLGAPRALRPAKALAAAFELGRRAEAARAKPPVTFSCPEDIASWAIPRLASLTHEELWLVGVDGRGRLRGVRCIAKGGLHGAAMRASDPLRAALRLDASGFVLVHNHPSGDPTPSAEDEALTQHVAEAGAVVGVPLLDHVVVAAGGFACVRFEPVSGRSRGGNGR